LDHSVDITGGYRRRRSVPFTRCLRFVGYYCSCGSDLLSSLRSTYVNGFTALITQATDCLKSNLVELC